MVLLCLERRTMNSTNSTWSDEQRDLYAYAFEQIMLRCLDNEKWNGRDTYVSIPAPDEEVFEALRAICRMSGAELFCGQLPPDNGWVFGVSETADWRRMTEVSGS